MNPFRYLKYLFDGKDNSMPATIDQDIINALQKAEDDQQAAVFADTQANTDLAALHQAQDTADHSHSQQHTTG